MIVNIYLRSFPMGDFEILEQAARREGVSMSTSGVLRWAGVQWAKELNRRKQIEDASNPEAPMSADERPR